MSRRPECRGPHVRSGRPTVVLAAYAADPAVSSETGIGWLFIKAMACAVHPKGATVVVLTTPPSAAAIAESVYKLDGEVEVIPVGLPSWLSFLMKPQLARGAA